MAVEGGSQAAQGQQAEARLGDVKKLSLLNLPCPRAAMRAAFPGDVRSSQRYAAERKQGRFTKLRLGRASFGHDFHFILERCRAISFDLDLAYSPPVPPTADAHVARFDECPLSPHSPIRTGGCASHSSQSSSETAEEGLGDVISRRCKGWVDLEQLPLELSSASIGSELHHKAFNAFQLAVSEK